MFICTFFAFKGFSIDTLKTQNLNLKMEDGKNIFQPKNDWWDKYSSGLIAGFTVLVSLGISVWQARKSQIHSKALVISEARIEWIKNLRPLLGNLISISAKINFSFSEFSKKFLDNKKIQNKNLTSEEEKELDEFKDEIFKLIYQFNMVFYEIKLYLNSEEKAHKYFITQVELFIDSAISQSKSENQKELKEEELIDSARLILKDAWEQAKKG